LAFIAIGLVLVWREHPIRAGIALTLGGVLAAAGLLVPTMLGPVERAWMKLAGLISKVTTPIFMGIVYFLVITPIGYLRGMKGSPIKRGRGASSWQPHAPAGAEGKQMERQF
jgi:hypothetical protein